jgi:hypothetical protein
MKSDPKVGIDLKPAADEPCKENEFTGGNGENRECHSMT